MSRSHLHRASGLAVAVVVLALGFVSCQGTPVRSSSPSAAGVAAAHAETTTAASASGTFSTGAARNPPLPAGATTTVAPATAVKPDTTTILTTPPTTAAPATPGAASMGSSGPQVMLVQQRLTDLGYWLGPADGRFGATTQQALFALQKAAGIPRTGVVDAATAAALDAGAKPTPMSTSGHLIEVDLARQLVLIVTNGHLDAVLNTSTGGGYTYYDHGSRQVAITPKGHFTTTWEVNGTRVSSLGVLWRPKYFVGGIAIHGDSYVPARPVSHGCVRVSNQAINMVWATGADPIGTPVWVY